MRSDHLVGLVDKASSGYCIIAHVGHSLVVGGQVGRSLVVGGQVGEPSNVVLKESDGGLLVLESNAGHKRVSTHQLTQGGNLLNKTRKVFRQIILVAHSSLQILDEIGWTGQLLQRIGSSCFKLERADAGLEDSSIDV